MLEIQLLYGEIEQQLYTHWTVRKRPKNSFDVLLYWTSSKQAAQRQVLPHDTRWYFNVRSKADIGQLNLPHRTDN